ncbi:DnaB-like helicase N-terminal domain-containing protein [Planomonospora parontospora]|uniref:DnaB-like helicase N-terminal domain-containing protein n=1 Tax=Planomonospora parontospora TaxID=58119 RepID=UPI001944A36C|nr:DnaB-like helicase N-terminal domain-containing protein [Planomonospora parontospora]
MLLGSSAKMGESLNLQNRVTDIIHMDPTPKPSMIDQRNGRGHRQGNQNAEIGIHLLGTKHSLDAFMYGLLTSKISGSRTVMTRDIHALQLLEIDEVEADFGTMQAELSGNPHLRDLFQMRAQLSALESDQRITAAQRAGDVDLLAAKQAEAAQVRSDIPRRADALPRIRPTTGPDFALALNGTLYDQVGPAGTALRRLVIDAMSAHTSSGPGPVQTIGAFGGLELAAQTDSSGEVFCARIFFPDLPGSAMELTTDDLKADAGGGKLIRGLRRALESAPDLQQADIDRLPGLEREIADLTDAVSRQVDYTDRIERARSRVYLLEAIVDAIAELDKLPPPTGDDSAGEPAAATERHRREAKVDSAIAALAEFDTAQEASADTGTDLLPARETEPSAQADNGAAADDSAARDEETSTRADGRVVPGRRWGHAWEDNGRRSKVNFSTSEQAQAALERFRAYEADPPARGTARLDNSANGDGPLRARDVIDLPSWDIYGGRVEAIRDGGITNPRAKQPTPMTEIEVRRADGTLVHARVPTGATVLRYLPDDAQAHRDALLEPIRERERAEMEATRAAIRAEQQARQELKAWDGTSEITEGNLRYGAERLGLPPAMADDAVAGNERVPGRVSTTAATFNQHLESDGLEFFHHSAMAAHALVDTAPLHQQGAIGPNLAAMLAALGRASTHWDLDTAYMAGRDLARRLMDGDEQALTDASARTRQGAADYLTHYSSAAANMQEPEGEATRTRVKQARQRLEAHVDESSVGAETDRAPVLSAFSPEAAHPTAAAPSVPEHAPTSAPAEAPTAPTPAPPVVPSADPPTDTDLLLSPTPAAPLAPQSRSRTLEPAADAPGPSTRVDLGADQMRTALLAAGFDPREFSIRTLRRGREPLHYFATFRPFLPGDSTEALQERAHAAAPVLAERGLHVAVHVWGDGSLLRVTVDTTSGGQGTVTRHTWNRTPESADNAFAAADLGATGPQQAMPAEATAHELPTYEFIHLLDARPGDVLRTLDRYGSWGAPIVYASTARRKRDIQLVGTHPDTGAPRKVTLRVAGDVSRIQRTIDAGRLQELFDQASAMGAIPASGPTVQPGDLIAYRALVEESFRDFLRGSPPPDGGAITVRGTVTDVLEDSGCWVIHLQPGGTIWEAEDGSQGTTRIFDEMVVTAENIVYRIPAPAPAVSAPADPAATAWSTDSHLDVDTAALSSADAHASDTHDQLTAAAPPADSSADLPAPTVLQGADNPADTAHHHEVQLLASLFLDPVQIAEVRQVLDGPEDFTDPELGRLYAAVLRLHDRGEPIEAGIARGSVTHNVDQLTTAMHAITSGQQPVAALPHALPLAELAAARLSAEYAAALAEPTRVYQWEGPVPAALAHAADRARDNGRPYYVYGDEGHTDARVSDTPPADTGYWMVTASGLWVSLSGTTIATISIADSDFDASRGRPAVVVTDVHADLEHKLAAEKPFLLAACISPVAAMVMATRTAENQQRPCLVYMRQNMFVVTDAVPPDVHAYFSVTADGSWLQHRGDEQQPAEAPKTAAAFTALTTLAPAPPCAAAAANPAAPAATSGTAYQPPTADPPAAPGIGMGL